MSPLPAPPPSPRLSVVVMVYNLRREAPRTLYSLSPAFQRGVDAREYEVLVMDDGSPEPLAPEMVRGFGDNFRYFSLEDTSPSPASAANIGARLARGDFLGMMVDGARIVSPGMLRLALLGLQAFPRPVVSSLAFHLGPDVQMESVSRGYDSREEDRLLAGIDWRRNGYRLFEISALAASSRYGWFQPIAESNCVFMTRDLFEELGGFDERFAKPGGGLVNHDFYYRACGLPDSQLLMLLGEGTFHQVHGGMAANRPADESARHWDDLNEEYRRLRGQPFRLPTRRPLLFGDVSAPGLDWVRRSCELFAQAYQEFEYLDEVR